MRPFSGQADLALAEDTWIGSVGGDDAGLLLKAADFAAGGGGFWAVALLAAGCFFVETDSTQMEAARCCWRGRIFQAEAA